MFFTTAGQFLKFRAARSSRSKAEMWFEVESDFLDSLLGLWDVLCGVVSVPNIPFFHLFPYQEVPKTGLVLRSSM